MHSILPASHHSGVEKVYPFKAAFAGGIGSALCDSSWDMGREQTRDNEGDKSEVEHGGHGAGRTAARLRLNRSHIASLPVATGEDCISPKQPKPFTSSSTRLHGVLDGDSRHVGRRGNANMRVQMTQGQKTLAES